MRQIIAGVPALVLAACIFTAAAATAEIAAIAAGSGPYLAVSQFPGGRELMRIHLDGEPGFSLSFIHSVSQTRVVDLYQVRGRDIVQTAERFKAHGAGLPSAAEEPRWILSEIVDRVAVPL